MDKLVTGPPAAHSSSIDRPAQENLRILVARRARGLLDLTGRIDSIARATST